MSNLRRGIYLFHGVFVGFSFKSSEIEVLMLDLISKSVNL